MSVLNLFADEWDERRTRPGYTWNRRGLGRQLAGELLGASLYELEPGQATWPYHWHWANEELAAGHGAAEVSPADEDSPAPST